MDSSEQAQQGRAYVTFLAGNGDYVKGVVGLAKGLRKVKSAYPLIVAILPDVPEEHREIMRSQGCIVREIEPINPPVDNEVPYARDYYIICYSKLRVWNFTEYKKVVFLDADIQVYDNIDELFDLSDGSIYGVIGCFCEKTWSHTPQYTIGYCQQCPEKVSWPAKMVSPPPPQYYNAGMFVFEPNRIVYEKLLETLKVTPPTAFAEQDFMNVFFEKDYKRITLITKIMSILWRHPENVELEKVKVIHYCAPGSKPWKFTGQEPFMDREDVKMLVKKWWDIYNDESLDFKPKRLEDVVETSSK